MVELGEALVDPAIQAAKYDDGCWRVGFAPDILEALCEVGAVLVRVFDYWRGERCIVGPDLRENGVKVADDSGWELCTISRVFFSSIGVIPNRKNVKIPR